MYIHGHFYNSLQERIEVHILTHGEKEKEMEIGTSKDIQWTDDPIDITSQVSDTFDVLLRYQASIRLLVRNFIPDFFCASCKDAVVNIYRQGKCIFAGFIEPQTYSQGYNEELDEIELNCIDVLSALEYAKYGNVGALGIPYGMVKAEASQKSMLEILKEMMTSITKGIDIKGENQLKYFYDGSKAIDGKKNNKYTIFSQLSISELLFLGSTEDDVWQQDEVMEEILKYLNLHIVQRGFDFYIISWESIKSGQSISWRDILTSGTTLEHKTRTVDITTDKVVGTDTTISIGEVYNQILLTCNIESIENVIESPLDEDLLKSPYSNKQKYMTEYSCEGEGERAINGFDEITHDRPTGYDAARITDWFVQVMDNPQWSFPRKGKGNLIDEYCKENKNQQALPNVLRKELGTAILSLGKVEKQGSVTDNSPISKISMTNYLVVSVNGNGENSDESKMYPNTSVLKNNIPCAIYKGNTSGGVFSPSDKDTTNYIVLSGKVVLNPIMALTDTFKAINTYRSSVGGIYQWWHRTVPSRNNGDGRYYTQRWWKADSPNKEVSWDMSVDYGLVPFTETGPQEYEFNYSAIGDGSDKISKIGVLACMLIIGDKCVVEERTQGQPSDFVWKPYKTLAQCKNEDEYYQQSFTIGFDPKIGDKLIGTKFDLQNNISYELGIDAEGTAIPIHKTDKVSGQVQFMILGPVNTSWDIITRRHPTFFRHTKWGSSTIPLLTHISSIFIESFEVKVYSNNGLVNNTSDNDLIYMSDTKEQFVNKKDDIKFKISSALTSDESKALGVTDSIKMSTPLNMTTGDAILSIYDYARNEIGKPEQFYVDSYYREYHEPRIQMVQKFMDSDGGIIDIFTHYKHPAMKKLFFVQGYNQNLATAEAEVTLKEIEQ